MAVVNTDLLIRSLMIQGIFVSFLFLGARFGDATLAANQVLMQFLFITGYAMDGFASAAETLVGQALGARQKGVLRRAAWVTSFWGLMSNIVLALLFALWGGWIIDVTTTSDEVREVARLYLPYMIAAPLLGWAAWLLDGIFVGATRSGDMRNMMVVSFLIYAVAAWALMPAYENHGLWAALLISFVARGVSLGLRYPALEAQAGQGSLIKPE